MMIVGVNLDAYRAVPHGAIDTTCIYTFIS